MHSNIVESFVYALTTSLIPRASLSPVFDFQYAGQRGEA